MRSLITIAAALSGLTTATVFPAEPGTVVEYTAEYEVRHKGRRMARAEFGVAADVDGQFVFNSSTKARGVWRLAAPKPAVERSVFNVEAGLVIPSRFDYQDGSRKGEDNYSVEFDAPAREIRIDGAAGAKSLPFEDELLDRGSLQVALMLDLGNCTLPGPYRYIDEDEIRVYRYERLEDVEAETGIGSLETIRFSQQREGSSRNTILWLAPELAYLPVRIEQIRNGEIETVFSLKDVNGLEREAPNCSGLG